MKKFLILVMMTLFFTGCSANNEREIKVHENKTIEVNTISTSDVKDIMDNNYDDVVIIDVRSSDEYRSGHIKDAINLPLDVIENIDIPKEQKIIVYCHSGRRSREAAIMLINLGYENVLDMGGIINWPYEIVE